MNSAPTFYKTPHAFAQPLTEGGRLLKLRWGAVEMRLDDREAMRARHAIASAPEAVRDALSLFVPPIQSAVDLEAFDALLAQFLKLEFDREGGWTRVDARGQGARGQGLRGEGA